jgi:S4 domain protein yaaA
MKEFTMEKITTEYITLQQFMKLSGIVSTGGEAKLRIKEMDIVVNGEKENRRGRKLYPDDKVKIEGKTYVVF